MGLLIGTSKRRKASYHHSSSSFFTKCSRKLGRLLNSIKYRQSNFGVSLLSEVIPVDMEAFLNAGLSFSEPPRYR